MEEPAVDNQDAVPSSGVVDAIKATPAPPPEKPTDTRTRRWIIVSFWAVAALLGLPVWIWTTTVHRASLPLDTMNRWAEGRACSLQFPVPVALDTSSLSERDADRLHNLLNLTINHHEYPFHRLQLFSATDSQAPEPVVTIRINTEGSGDEPRAELHQYAPILDIYCSAAYADSKSVFLGQFVSSAIVKLFAEELVSLSRLMHHDTTASSYPLFTEMAHNLERRSMRSFRYAPTYHLTFSLFSATSSPSAWDIKAALDEYLAPLLESFSPISTFTVDTQVQLYAALSPSMHGPVYNEETKQWMLQKSDLTSFINAAEWPLSPSIGAGPTINFVLYAPSEDRSPMVIAETGGNSWLIPQWGGVQILNDHPGAARNRTSLSKGDLEPFVHTLADQLISLFGLPQTPASLPLRMSSLTRERSTSLILSASSTLGALARLSLKLTSIAIPDNVAKSVQKTVHHLEQSCTDLREGRFQSALQNARVAEGEAEQAFLNRPWLGKSTSLTSIRWLCTFLC
ncbi:GPI transamidase component [Taxawa tesnikishii (nom. ined.)]|nr:GPI transamidase component [Dothideales sp. JES 119]